jgi:hypothetical protein
MYEPQPTSVVIVDIPIYLLHLIEEGAHQSYLNQHAMERNDIGTTIIAEYYDRRKRLAGYHARIRMEV